MMRETTSSPNAIARRARLSTREIAIAIALTIAALTGLLVTFGGTQVSDHTQETAATSKDTAPRLLKAN